MVDPFVPQSISDICQIVGVKYLNENVNMDMTNMISPSTKQISVNRLLTKPTK